MHIHEHHQSLRHRGHTFYGNAKLKHKVDMLAYVSSFLNLAFSTDQARIIWSTHNAAGVSFLTWLMATIASVVWLFYGLVHKDKVITVVNAIWIGLSLTILIGVALYGNNLLS